MFTALPDADPFAAVIRRATGQLDPAFRPINQSTLYIPYLDSSSPVPALALSFLAPTSAVQPQLQSNPLCAFFKSPPYLPNLPTTMHLSTATMTAVLALGMSVSALPADPQQQQPPQEKHEQHTSGPSDQGEKACCVSSSTIESSTLARGLITNLLGASDQACATTALIEKLNLLGFSEQKNGNHECTETSAKCHGDVVCFFSPSLSS